MIERTFLAGAHVLVTAAVAQHDRAADDLDRRERVGGREHEARPDDVDARGRGREHSAAVIVVGDIGDDAPSVEPDVARVGERQRRAVVEHDARAVGEVERGTGAVVGAHGGVGGDRGAKAQRLPGIADANGHAVGVVGSCAVGDGERADRSVGRSGARGRGRRRTQRR